MELAVEFRYVGNLLFLQGVEFLQLLVKFMTAVPFLCNAGLKFAGQLVPTLKQFGIIGRVS